MGGREQHNRPPAALQAQAYPPEDTSQKDSDRESWNAATKARGGDADNSQQDMARDNNIRMPLDTEIKHRSLRKGRLPTELLYSILSYALLDSGRDGNQWKWLLGLSHVDYSWRNAVKDWVCQSIRAGDNVSAYFAALFFWWGCRSKSRLTLVGLARRVQDESEWQVSSGVLFDNSRSFIPVGFIVVEVDTLWRFLREAACSQFLDRVAAVSKVTMLGLICMWQVEESVWLFADDIPLGFDMESVHGAVLEAILATEHDILDFEK